MKAKRTLTATLSAVLALTVGFGIWRLKPEVKPSAEANEIESVQKIVGALPPTVLDVDVQYITISAGDTIDTGIADTQEFNAASPEEGITNIADRDWTIYDDEYGLSKMASSENEFYHRLESVGVKYITDSTLDAFPMERYDIYVTKGINYDDLGLSKNQAIGLTQWFIYNNPQYYFYQTRFLVSDVAIYMGCYPAFVDGDDRAEATNKLFNTVDSWVDSINDDEVSTYQKVLSAHDLICDKVDYVAGEYDQSIYSTVIQRKTVCAGYAGMMNVMLNASGIHSTVGISSTHAWNVVQLDDGVYYGFDSTWDDSLKSRKLFAVGENDLKKYDSKGTEHIYVYPWTEYAPVCAENNYSPSYYDLNGEEEVVAVCTPYDFNASFNGTTATVTWKSDDANGYKYEVAGRSGNVVKSGLKLTNVAAGSSLDLKITAYKIVSDVTYYSDTATYTVTVPHAEDITLDAPVLVSSATDVSGRYEITWTSVPSAEFYTYDISAYSDFRSVISTNSRYTNTGLYVSNIAEGRTYYVRARAGAIINGKTTYSDYGTVIVSRPAAVVMTAATTEAKTATTKETTTTVNSARSTATDTVVTTKPAATTTSAATKPAATTTTAATTTVPGRTSGNNNTGTTAAPLKSPADVTFTKKTTSIYKLAWDSVLGASRYEYIAASDSGFKNIIANSSTTKNFVTISGLKNTSMVYIKIRAVGNSDSEWTVLTFTK